MSNNILTSLCWDPSVTKSCGGPQVLISMVKLKLLRKLYLEMLWLAVVPRVKVQQVPGFDSTMTCKILLLFEDVADESLMLIKGNYIFFPNSFT